MTEPAEATRSLRTSGAPADPEGVDSFVEDSIYDLTYRVRGGSRLVEDAGAAPEPEVTPARSA